jgi:hypothetical protein
MARYGEDAERLKSSADAWAAGDAKFQEMLAKEARGMEASRTTTGRNTEAIRANAAAREEAASVSERSAAAAEKEAAATRIQTAEIEKLAAARRRAAAAAPPRVSGAIRGSMDPLVAQAPLPAARSPRTCGRPRSTRLGPNRSWQKPTGG